MRDADSERFAAADLPLVLTLIRNRAIDAARETWTELGAVLNALLPDPLDPMALLPIATGRAAGGTIDELIPVAAAILLSDVAFRIADDCMDADVPNALHDALGAKRAVNIAMALSMTATRELVFLRVQPGKPDALLENAFRAYGDVCAGQDREASIHSRTLEDYEQTVRLKTVAAYSFAAEAGARAASSDEDAIARCAECGAQLGWMAQHLDDLEALWFPVIDTDSVDQLTFPAVLGLASNHPGRARLDAACANTPIDRAALCDILDGMAMRSTVMTRALDHRDRAIAALGSPLHPEGAAILRVWLDWLLRDAERFLPDDERIRA